MQNAYVISGASALSWDDKRNRRTAEWVNGMLLIICGRSRTSGSEFKVPIIERNQQLKETGQNSMAEIINDEIIEALEPAEVSNSYRLHELPLLRCATS